MPRKSVPSYRLHKPSGQARTIIDGRHIYLGKFNSPDLTSEILSAVMDSMDAQTELSTRALNSEQIREGLKLILLDRLGLYENLRTRASSA